MGLLDFWVMFIFQSRLIKSIQKFFQVNSILDHKLPPIGDNDTTTPPDSAFDDDQDLLDTDDLSDDNIDDDNNN